MNLDNRQMHCCVETMYTVSTGEPLILPYASTPEKLEGWIGWMDGSSGGAA